MNMNGFITVLALVVVFGCPVAPVFGAEPKAVESIPGATAKDETVSPPSAGDVIARVNGIAITRGEVDRTIRIFLAQSRVSHDLSPDARRQAEDSALEQLIGAKLLYLAGLTLKIKDLDGQVVEKMAQARSKFSSLAEYEAALAADNLTEQEAQVIVRNDIVVSNLLDKEIIDKVTIPEPDIKKYYDQNRDKFTRPESVRLSHILIEVAPEAAPDEKRIARGKAESLRKKILRGADFATIARTDSSCPSKEQGGDLGDFGKGEMIPEFETAVATLKPGEISQVVETQFGYHIFKLVEKNKAAVGTFDETREKIKDYLKQTRARQAIIDYVTELKKSSTIEMIANK